MTDISKCNNKLCHRKSTCYRWTAPSGEYQSYIGSFEMTKEQMVERAKNCEHYWRVKR